jgi:hypothetical protein
MEENEVFEFMQENNLLEEGLKLCETDKQREEYTLYVQELCKMYQPILNQVKNVIKTDEDRKRLMEYLTNKDVEIKIDNAD